MAVLGHHTSALATAMFNSKTTPQAASGCGYNVLTEPSEWMPIFYLLACSLPLGLTDGRIRDEQISASSELDEIHAAKGGRVSLISPSKSRYRELVYSDSLLHVLYLTFTLRMTWLLLTFILNQLTVTFTCLFPVHTRHIAKGQSLME